MNIDKYGCVILNEKDLIDLLYTGNNNSIFDVYTTQQVSKIFNQSKNINKDLFNTLKEYTELSLDIKDFDLTNQQNWFFPKNYCSNLIEDLYIKCTTEEQKNRVTEELDLFIQHNMLDLLFYLKYLVDIMRENNIVWGVGRGSSVASYVLYLIGVHKIDSIKYNLDINEFIK
jgi:DNA polymerase III alpha subunit